MSSTVIDLDNYVFRNDTAALRARGDALGLPTDFQFLDAEIIDYGISEDEFEESNEVLLVDDNNPPAPLHIVETDNSILTTATHATSDNSYKIKQVNVKLVDCQKYPSYYPRYKKHLDKIKYIEAVKNARDILHGLKVGLNINQIFTLSNDNNLNDKTGYESKTTKKDKTYRKNTMPEEEITDLLVINEGEKYTNSNDCLNKKKNYDETINFKTDPNEKQSISLTIDIQKNTGLIGMKVQRIERDSCKKYSKVSKNTGKYKENNEKRINSKPPKMKIGGEAHSSPDYSKNVKKLQTDKEPVGNGTIKNNDATQCSISKIKEPIMCSIKTNPPKILMKFTKIKESNSKKNIPAGTNETCTNDSFKYKPMPKSKRLELETKNKNNQNQLNKYSSVILNTTRIHDDKKSVFFPKNSQDTVSQEYSPSHLNTFSEIKTNENTSEINYAEQNEIFQHSKSPRSGESYDRILMKSSTSNINCSSSVSSSLHSKFNMAPKNSPIPTFKNKSNVREVTTNCHISPWEKMTAKYDYSVIKANNIEITTKKKSSDVSKAARKLKLKSADFSVTKTKKQNSIKLTCNLEKQNHSGEANKQTNKGEKIELKQSKEKMLYDGTCQDNRSAVNEHLKSEEYIITNLRSPPAEPRIKQKVLQNNTEKKLKGNKIFKPKETIEQSTVSLSEQQSNKQQQLYNYIPTECPYTSSFETNLSNNLINSVPVCSRFTENPKYCGGERLGENYQCKTNFRARLPTSQTLDFRNKFNLLQMQPNLSSTIPIAHPRVPSTPQNVQKVFPKKSETARILPPSASPGVVASQSIVFRKIPPSRFNQYVARPQSLSQMQNGNFYQHHPPKYVFLPSTDKIRKIPWCSIYPPTGVTLGQNMVSDPTLHDVINSSGNCDFLPQNFQEKYTGHHLSQFLPPPPPPPPLPATHQNTLTCSNSSVIGENVNGPITKINVHNLVHSNLIDADGKDCLTKREKTKLNPETKNPETVNRVSDNICSDAHKMVHSISAKTETIKELENAIGDTPPIFTKIEMIRELDKAMAFIESPEKPALKRSISNELFKQTNDLRRAQPNNTQMNKARQHSKKLKLDNRLSTPPRNSTLVSKTGYSPPILPIPTFQNVLSEVHTGVSYARTKVAPPSVDHSNSTKTSVNASKRHIHSVVNATYKNDDCKKISLEQYKQRSLNLTNCEKNSEKTLNDDDFIKCKKAKPI